MVTGDTLSEDVGGTDGDDSESAGGFLRAVQWSSMTAVVEAVFMGDAFSEFGGANCVGDAVRTMDRIMESEAVIFEIAEGREEMITEESQSDEEEDDGAEAEQGQEEPISQRESLDWSVAVRAGLKFIHEVIRYSLLY